MNAIPRVDYFTTLDRYRLINQGDENRDPSEENFGKPDFYMLSDVDASHNGVKIHYTRIVLFQGVELPPMLFRLNEYWGDSVLSRLINVLRNYQTSNDSVATIIQDYAQAVFKLKGLSDLIASGDHSVVAKRLDEPREDRITPIFV